MMIVAASIFERCMTINKLVQCNNANAWDVPSEAIVNGGEEMAGGSDEQRRNQKVQAIVCVDNDEFNADIVCIHII
jgi:hypothetical protein